MSSHLLELPKISSTMAGPMLPQLYSLPTSASDVPVDLPFP